MLRTAAALLLAAGPLRSAVAQERPSEEELFGPPAGEQEPAPPATSGSSVEERLFGERPAERPRPAGVVTEERDDPLRLGGQLYLRGVTTWQDGVDPSEWPLSSPDLLDLYLDARPNDRVRAFALGRLRYDPTLEGEAEDSLAALGSGGADPLAALLGGEPASNPEGVIDQLWVNFDVGRRVFVTAGKQHVKWGVGRFWNPTDYLHRQARDPLDVFDARTGTTLVKLHAPWEARGWNAYGILLLEDTMPSAVRVRRLGRVGAGGRVEAVIGTFELGLDALVADGRKPRFGIDASLGVWEVDLYAEAALRSGATRPRWREVDPSAPYLALPGSPTRFAEEEVTGLTPSFVAGGSWSRNYTDEDFFTVGVEWFWQEAGYDGATVYPFLLFGAPQVVADPTTVPDPRDAVVQRDPGAFTPFYLGRQYAGAFASLPAPGSWNDTTLTLSALANLSDRSYIVRLDHSVVVLTYLRVETYAAVHGGRRGGEFRFALDLAPSELSSPPLLGPIRSPPPVLDLGVAVRVDL